MAHNKKIRPSSTLLACGIATTLLPPLFASDQSLQGQAPSFSLDLSALSRGLVWPLRSGIGGAIVSFPSSWWVINGSQLQEYSLDGQIKTNLALGEEAYTLCKLNQKQFLIGFATRVEIFQLDQKTRQLWADLGPSANITAILAHGQNVYIADSSQKLVFRYSTGGALGSIISGGQGGHFVVPSPYFTIAPGPADTVWISNPGRHRVERYSAAGQLLEQFGTASDSLEGFAGCCNPMGIVALENGSLITREKGLQRLKLYDSHGRFQKLLAGPESFMHRPISPAMTLRQNQLFYFDGPLLKSLSLPREASL